MKKTSLLACSLAIALAAPTDLPAADSLPQLVRLLGESRDTQLQLDLLRGLSQAMEGRPQVPMPAGWDAVEPTLARSGNGEIRSLTQALGLKFGSPAALTALKQILRDSQAETGERRNALRALLTVRDAELPALLQALVRDPALSGDAVRGLAAFADEQTPGAILSAYASLSDEARRDAMNTLASRPAFARLLLLAVDQDVVPKQALTADLLRQLRSLNDADVKAALEKVYGTFRESPADKQQQINQFKAVYFAGGSTPGDAPRGRMVYDRICAQCHTLFDVGGTVGPDLTGSARSDLDYILQNMVDPNAVIPNEYRTSTIEMKDDRVITGIVKSQDQNALTVATANETLVLPRKDIAEVIQSELSMMPEGLLDTLTDQEVRDLIYYLRQPAQASLPAE